MFIRVRLYSKVSVLCVYIWWVYFQDIKTCWWIYVQKACSKFAYLSLSWIRYKFLLLKIMYEAFALQCFNQWEQKVLQLKFYIFDHTFQLHVFTGSDAISKHPQRTYERGNWVHGVGSYTQQAVSPDTAWHWAFQIPAEQQTAQKSVFAWLSLAGPRFPCAEHTMWDAVI